MARIWDPSEGLQLSVLGSGDRFRHIRATFSPSGRHVLSVSFDNTARLWHSDKHGAETVFQGHKRGTGPLTGLHDAAFSPDGKRVITAGSDKTARIWNAATGRALAVLGGHQDDVHRVTFSPDGNSVATASADGTVRLWRLAGEPPLAQRAEGGETWNETAALQGHENWVRAVHFSPDGSRLLTHSDDRTARLWDATTGASIAVVGAAGETIQAGSFSPDGKRFLTVSSAGTARLWQSDTGAELAVFTGHAKWVRSARFSPDGRLVLTSSDDKSARIWDAASAKSLVVMGRVKQGWYMDPFPVESVRDAAFSSTGKRVLTVSSDNKVRIWDAKSGGEIAVLHGDARTREETVETGAIYAHFSPDDRRMLASGADGAVRLWDVSWATGVFGAGLRERVCGEKLFGVAQEFTREDLEDPILRGIDADDAVSRNPCLRRGPLSLEYWIRLPGQWWAALRGLQITRLQ